MPTINQAKVENATKGKGAPAGHQKPSLQVHHPLFNEKGKERAVKTKVKSSRKASENDELYNQLHQLGQRQLRSLAQPGDPHAASDYPAHSNIDAASTKQSNPLHLAVGKAKTPVAGTKVKTSYDYGSHLPASSHQDNRTPKIQYELYNQIKEHQNQAAAKYQQ